MFYRLLILSSLFLICCNKTLIAQATLTLVAPSTVSSASVVEEETAAGEETASLSMSDCETSIIKGGVTSDFRNNKIKFTATDSVAIFDESDGSQTLRRVEKDVNNPKAEANTTILTSGVKFRPTTFPNIFIKVLALP